MKGEIVRRSGWKESLFDWQNRKGIYWELIYIPFDKIRLEEKTKF